MSWPTYQDEADAQNRRCSGAGFEYRN